MDRAELNEAVERLDIKGAVKAAFRAVDRARFVPEPHASLAYVDAPLPIGHGQTISQPSLVALMLDWLDVHNEHRVLEVGAGSGYALALLEELSDDVTGLEAVRELAVRAKGVLPKSRIIVGAVPPDGLFDRILVSAAAPKMPLFLLERLALGGKMIVPVGTHEQWLYRVARTEEGHSEERLIAVRFVPLRPPSEGT